MTEKILAQFVWHGVPITVFEDVISMAGRRIRYSLLPTHLKRAVSLAIITGEGVKDNAPEVKRTPQRLAETRYTATGKQKR